METENTSSGSVLRMTAEQHERLRKHLFPADACESVALALCGTRFSENRLVYCVREILEIPDQVCALRSPTTVRWPVEMGMDLFSHAAKSGMAILKIHSHPTGFEQFSEHDNESDEKLLGALCEWVDQPIRHVSAFMLPDGTVKARIVNQVPTERCWVERVVIVGDEIRMFHHNAIHADFDGADLRTRQAFGDGTTRTLKSVRVGVVGCSGTGSWVIEMLARLGVGDLVLVDPDHVERKNLNRILNSTGDSAKRQEHKVEILSRAVIAMDLGTKVSAYARDLVDREVIEALAECDVLFGCLDSADGRDLLNRIATFYTIPFIDIGVHLQADGKGGINQICCAVHYLIPGGSSLLSRGVITPEQVTAEAMRRHDPDAYRARLKEDYIKGVQVESPAVISINGFAASHAVNEMLARIHPFRFDENFEYRHQTFSLRDGSWIKVPDGAPCAVLGRRLGRGDSKPLLDNPAIT